MPSLNIGSAADSPVKLTRPSFDPFASAAQYDAIAVMQPFGPPLHLTTGPWLRPDAAYSSSSPAPSSSPSSPPPAAASNDGSITAASSSVVTLTVRALLDCCLDIHGVPRRSFFEQLAFFASRGSEAEVEAADKLAEMGAPEGADLYYSYCTKERRSYAEVLMEFPSVHVPLAYLLELIPPLQPRSFSIASSALASPGRVHLCVAVVHYDTPWGRHKAGVCSNWLASLRPGDVFPMAIKRGTFSVPVTGADVSVCSTVPPPPPLLLIGPGTGIAPMRSIVLERAALAAAAAAANGSLSPSSTVAAGGWMASIAGRSGSVVENDVALVSAGDSSAASSSNAIARQRDLASSALSLYFGCRHRAHDWLYGRQMTSLLSPLPPPSPFPVAGSNDSTNGAPTPLPPASASPATAAGSGGGPLDVYETAFSRDVPGRKIYVQGLLLRQKEALFRLLTERGAVVLIAGVCVCVMCHVQLRSESWLVFCTNLSHFMQLLNTSDSHLPPSPPRHHAGNAKMPADVIDVLKEVLTSVGGASDREAEVYLAAMERGKRLQVEAWS